MEAHRQTFQLINQCGHELITIDKNRRSSDLLPVLDRVNKNWQAVAIRLINHSRKFDEVVKCSEKYHGTLQPLKIWLDKMEGRVTTLSTVAVQPQMVLEQMSEQKSLMNDALNHKGSVEILSNVSHSLVSVVRPPDISGMCELCSSVVCVASAVCNFAWPPFIKSTSLFLVADKVTGKPK